MLSKGYKTLVTTVILLVYLGTALGADGDIHPAILGGTPITNMNQAPWMALVIPKNIAVEQPNVATTNPPCGGVLVALDRVLTTAQCVTFKDGTLVQTIGEAEIWVETADSSDAPPNKDTCDPDVNCALVHPDYDPDTLVGNIAIVYLAAEFTPADATTLLPIPMVDNDATANYTNAEVTIYGWGGDSGSATSLSPALRAAIVNVHSESRCLTYWDCEGKDNAYSHTDELCFGGINAAGTVTNVGACGRDIGGAIVANYKPGGNVTQAVLVGLISFFKSSAEPTCVPKPQGNATTAAAAAAGTTQAPTTTTTSTKTMIWNLFTSVLRSFIGANVEPENRTTLRMAVNHAYSARQGRQTIYTGNSCKTDTPAVGIRVAAFDTWLTENL